MHAGQSDLEAVTPHGDSLKDTFPVEEFVPIGTFADSQEFILRIRNGKPVAANTGDQGGGQN
ncbi:MAG: hypothetical protein JO275_10860 [Verrucomicrobia bacterium]|nr:hypothetical protein [Verrucomicrobiota bacterium]